MLKRQVLRLNATKGSLGILKKTLLFPLCLISPSILTATSFKTPWHVYVFAWVCGSNGLCVVWAQVFWSQRRLETLFAQPQTTLGTSESHYSHLLRWTRGRNEWDGETGTDDDYKRKTSCCMVQTREIESCSCLRFVECLKNKDMPH